jgi:hypothetical protein
VPLNGGLCQEKEMAKQMESDPVRRLGHELLEVRGALWFGDSAAFFWQETWTHLVLGQLVKQEDFARAAEVRDALRAAVWERDSLHLQLRLHAQLSEGRQREEETHKWLMADKVRGLEHVLSALVEEELYEEARNVSEILHNETRARDQVHSSFDGELIYQKKRWYISEEQPEITKKRPNFYSFFSWQEKMLAVLKYDLGTAQGRMKRLKKDKVAKKTPQTLFSASLCHEYFSFPLPRFALTLASHSSHFWTTSYRRQCSQRTTQKPLSCARR